MSRISLVLLVSVGLASTAGPAMSQQYGRTNDPNFTHFYMARQQIEVIDESPIVKFNQTPPGAAGAGGPPGGGMPGGGPVPLPKAGFQGYSPAMPGIRTDLPKVNTGVPPKLPQAPSPIGTKGKAGALKAHAGGGKKAGPGGPAGARANPNALQTYNAYKGYGLTMPATTGAGASSGPSTSTSTAVQGSVLHWARNKRPNY